jgi:hypothetical protein
MQLAEERRIQTKRIEIARPLEIVDPTGDDVVEGYTRNLSETGIRARFEGCCSVGADLVVRITLEEDAPPVEKRAQVIWSRPDSYGEGMDVGLRLVTAEDEAEGYGAIESPGTGTLPLLFVGGEVEIEYEGAALPAKVTRIGEMTDSGCVQVTLRMIDNPKGGGVFYDLAKARGFWMRYGLPLVMKLTASLGSLSRRAGALLSAKIPERIATPIERLWTKAALPARVSRTWSALSNAKRTLVAKFRGI